MFCFTLGVTLKRYQSSLVKTMVINPEEMKHFAVSGLEMRNT